jgi:hypothetical protein
MSISHGSYQELAGDIIHKQAALLEAVKKI